MSIKKQSFRKTRTVRKPRGSKRQTNRKQSVRKMRLSKKRSSKRLRGGRKRSVKRLRGGQNPPTNQKTYRVLEPSTGNEPKPQLLGNPEGKGPVAAPRTRRAKEEVTSEEVISRFGSNTTSNVPTRLSRRHATLEGYWNNKAIRERNIKDRPDPLPADYEQNVPPEADYSNDSNDSGYENILPVGQNPNFPNTLPNVPPKRP